MAFLIESGTTLTFPDANGFRLSNCSGYLTLSGNYFKEMDAGWIDTDNSRVLLFELKDFSSPSSISGKINERIFNLTKKSIDVLQIMLCVQKQGALAADFETCLPVPIANYELEFYAVIHAPNQEADIQLIHDKFRTIFSPYARIWGIRKYAVMEKQQAVNRFPDIVS
jgi:hypothetical protein